MRTAMKMLLLLNPQPHPTPPAKMEVECAECQTCNDVQGEKDQIVSFVCKACGCSQEVTLA